MVWDIFKIGCRVYAAAMAGALLFQLVGYALTGGLRVTVDDLGPMSPTAASLMASWCVAILVTCSTKSDA